MTTHKSPFVVSHMAKHWTITIGSTSKVLDFASTKAEAVSIAEKEARKVGRPGVLVYTKSGHQDMFHPNNHYWFREYKRPE